MPVIQRPGEGLRNSLDASSTRPVIVEKLGGGFMSNSGPLAEMMMMIVEGILSKHVINILILLIHNIPSNN